MERHAVVAQARLLEPVRSGPGLEGGEGQAQQVAPATAALAVVPREQDGRGRLEQLDVRRTRPAGGPVAQVRAERQVGQPHRGRHGQRRGRGGGKAQAQPPDQGGVAEQHSHRPGDAAHDPVRPGLELEQPAPADAQGRAGEYEDHRPGGRAVAQQRGDAQQHGGRHEGAQQAHAGDRHRAQVVQHRAVLRPAAGQPPLHEHDDHQRGGGRQQAEVPDGERREPGRDDPGEPDRRGRRQPHRSGPRDPARQQQIEREEARRAERRARQVDGLHRPQPPAPVQQVAPVVERAAEARHDDPETCGRIDARSRVVRLQHHEPGAEKPHDDPLHQQQPDVRRQVAQAAPAGMRRHHARSIGRDEDEADGAVSRQAAEPGLSAVPVLQRGGGPVRRVVGHEFLRAEPQRGAGALRRDPALRRHHERGGALRPYGDARSLGVDADPGRRCGRQHEHERRRRQHQELGRRGQEAGRRPDDQPRRGCGGQPPAPPRRGCRSRAWRRWT